MQSYRSSQLRSSVRGACVRRSRGPSGVAPTLSWGRCPHGKGHQSWGLRDEPQEPSRQRGRSVGRGKGLTGLTRAKVQRREQSERWCLERDVQGVVGTMQQPQPES